MLEAVGGVAVGHLVLSVLTGASVVVAGMLESVAGSSAGKVV